MEEKNREKNEQGGEGKSRLSRRKWLIDVGSAAALAGIAGTTGHLQADAFPALAPSESNSAALPPGLYRPSFGHLGRAMEDVSRFHPIPPGCPVDFVRPRSGPFQPQFFSADEYKVTHRLTALMLGESSATSVGKSQESIVDEVAEWIDLHTYSFAEVRAVAEKLTPEQVAVAQTYNGAPLLHGLRTTDPQKTYRAGLEWIAAESERRHGNKFIELAENQQTALLDAISDDRANRETENDGTRFFTLLKDDIISGFYTSRTGLKELDYKGNRYYAESPGCTLPEKSHSKSDH